MGGKDGELVRGLGYFGLCAVVINGMIGAGIFALPYAMAQRTGGWSPFLILAMGVVLLPLLAVLARLAGMFTATGGPILYAEQAFGRNAGFLVGWLQMLSVASATAANANALADYALAGRSAWSGTLPHLAATLAALAVVIALNLIPSRRTASFLELASFAKILPLLLLCILVAPDVAGFSPASIRPASPEPVAAVLLACYAMFGFEGSLTLAGEARDPRRDLPRALFTAFILSTVVYALVVAAYCVSAYDPAVSDGAPLATLAGKLLGGAGGVFVLFAAGWSILGNMTQTVLGNSRRLYALERQGDLPGWFGRVSAGHGVPRNAVIAIGLFTVGLAVSGGFTVLAVLSVAARLLVYLCCISALPVVRHRRGEAMSTIEKASVAFAGALCLWLVSQSNVQSWLALLATMAAGIAVLILARRSRTLIATG